MLYVPIHIILQSSLGIILSYPVVVQGLLNCSAQGLAFSLN